MSGATAASAKLNGVRKAAVLLVLLGEEAAAKVYRHLNQTQLQRLTQEIRELGEVNPEVAADVLEEYNRLSLTQEYLTIGGESYARSLLIKAFGNEGARALLEQVSRAQVLTATQMDALQRANPKELARFLEGEQPQTIAIILAYLDAKAASALLMRLPEALRVESVKRLALLRNSRDGAESIRSAA
jgi:flagellar motor switch protein FliG